MYLWIVEVGEWPAPAQGNKQCAVADFAIALRNGMDDGMGQLRTTVVRSS